LLGIDDSDMNDEILIGKYHFIEYNGKWRDFIEVKMKYGLNITTGDIMTLDMIEPYESEAVRKVAKYIDDNLYPEYTENKEYAIDHAKVIVKLVHEAEDADE